MAAPPPVPRVFQFGVFAADLRTGELRKNGLRVKLGGQPFEILSLLLLRAGDVVTREELRERLWPVDTFVDFDHSLNSAINKLRDALGDSAEKPKFVETLARRGYRFIAPVRETNGHASNGVVFIEEAGNSFGNWREKFLWPSRGAVLLFGVAAVVTAAALLGSLYNGGRSPRAAEPPPRVVPFTSYPGHVRYPRFSPDGKHIAFVWTGEQGLNEDIYVKLVGTEQPLRLTTHPHYDRLPAWSPDGTRIAFVRYADQGPVELLMIPAFGGTEHKLLEYNLRRPAGLDWSPDGKYLVYEDRDSPTGPITIHLLTVETGEKRKLVSPPEGTSADSRAVFSPDGKWIAFMRAGHSPSEILLLPLAGGPLRQVVAEKDEVFSLSWSPDSKSVVYAANRGDGVRLWKMAIEEGDPEPILEAGENATHATFSKQGNRMAFVRNVEEDGIWRVELPQPNRLTPVVTPLINSTREDIEPNFSPDGRKILFLSDRSGSREVWMCEANGTQPVQLTNVGGAVVFAPSWSPDGKQFLYVTRGGPTQLGQRVYLQSLGGAAPRLMSDGGGRGNDDDPVWSRDGRTIYFNSVRTGTSQLYKMPATGGPATQLTTRGGCNARESHDEKYLYFTKLEERGIWKIPVAGGEEEKVVDVPEWTSSWDLVSDGIYFLDRGELTNPGLYWFSFATRKVTRLATLPGPTRPWGGGLTVSPDRRWLLYTQKAHWGSDILLVENFR